MLKFASPREGPGPSNPCSTEVPVFDIGTHLWSISHLKWISLSELVVVGTDLESGRTVHRLLLCKDWASFSYECSSHITSRLLTDESIDTQLQLRLILFSRSMCLEIEFARNWSRTRHSLLDLVRGFCFFFLFFFPSVRLEDHYSKAMHTSGLSFPATESWKEKLKQYKPLIYLGGLTLGYIVFHLNSWSPEAILPLCFFIS